MSHEPRDPPAYQEFAANMLAQIPFRTLSMAERGLLYTMRLECWVNQRLPADHRTLAAVLGQPVPEVEQTLPAVLAFFREDDGMLFSPELENYRKKLTDQRRTLSEAGRKGAKKTNSRKRKGEPTGSDTATPAATPTAGAQPPRRGGAGPLIQHSTVQHSPTQLTGEGEHEELEELAEYGFDEEDLPF